MNNGYNIEDYLSFVEQGRFDKISNNAVKLIVENLKHSRKQVKNLTRPVVVKSLPTDDAEFIYSLLPKWAKDAPKGLNPTMYGTLTQEGDQKVIDRVKGILGNV